MTESQTVTPLDDPLPTLFAATAEGDRQAFARLYQLTKGRLMAVALRIVRERPLAEEVLQDAYVTIWRNASRQTQRRAPFAWMATIVRHRAIDRWRTQRGSREIRTKHIDNEILVTLAIDTDSDEILEQLADAIRECIRALKPEQRQAILLAYYYGMAHGEIASELEAPLGTVKSWVRRGLLQLKDCMDHE